MRVNKKMLANKQKKGGGEKDVKNNEKLHLYSSTLYCGIHLQSKDEDNQVFVQIVLIFIKGLSL